MVYVKNVPSWERLLRIVVGAMAIGFAFVDRGSPWAVSAGVLGAILATTGLVGFCPMCATVGRELDKGQ